MPANRSIIARARAEGRVLLSEVESKDLLRSAGLNVVDTRLAGSREESVAIAGHIGFPVALKVVAAEITHKTDAGGVKLNLRTAAEVGAAHDSIAAAVKQRHPRALVQGVSVQRMLPPGIEVVVGMSRDPQFGPVLMFGLGGILVEILKDVSFRIVPLTRRDAGQMVREIKGYPLLTGYRGQTAANIGKLEDMLLALSAFMEQAHDIRELDLNPVLACADDAIAVDARVILNQ